MSDDTHAADPAAPEIHIGELDLASMSGRLPDADGGVKAIVNLANKAAEVEHYALLTKGLGEGFPERVPFLVDRRPGGGVVALKNVVEHYRLRPERRVGVAQAATLKSFIDLVNRHKDDHTAIFAQVDWPNPKLLAIVDYHKLNGEPRWLKHRIEYAFPVTEEFTAWIENDGELFEQHEFALFLEEHAAELAAPFDAEKIEFERLFKEKMASPNEVIALSRDLEIKVGARVKRQERLSSGERTVEFVEEHLNGNGEKVSIPGIFMVSVPAFLDGEAVRVPARLRYRIAHGTIKWGYQLYRWRHWLRLQVQNDMNDAAKATQLPAYEGAPEA